ncbi:MAG: CtsR family transcriptional regulator [Clostridiales bacterium]|nr:CtsR family transcriptional regulator [Clostridiales bacterium]
MRISDTIASFLNSLLNDKGGIVEIQRSELAERFACVPSQINYVIETRFSPEHGFLVESRRGGGGYIRITRVSFDSQTAVMHTINAIREEIDARSAEMFIENLIDMEEIHPKVARILTATVSDRALSQVPPELRNRLRASILKTALVALIS